MPSLTISTSDPSRVSGCYRVTPRRASGPDWLAAQAQSLRSTLRRAHLASTSLRCRRSERSRATSRVASPLVPGSRSRQMPRAETVWASVISPDPGRVGLARDGGACGAPRSPRLAPVFVTLHGLDGSGGHRNLGSRRSCGLDRLVPSQLTPISRAVESSIQTCRLSRPGVGVG